MLVRICACAAKRRLAQSSVRVQLYDLCRKCLPMIRLFEPTGFAGFVLANVRQHSARFGLYATVARHSIEPRELATMLVRQNRAELSAVSK
jgi:hypothetical protein